MGRITHLTRLGVLAVIVALSATIALVSPAAASPPAGSHVRPDERGGWQPRRGVRPCV